MRDNGSTPFETENNNFMPRIGFAWQATPTTVFRGGYGMFYDVVGVNRSEAIQIGFSQTTPIQPSLDNGLTFIASNANPLPNGLLPPLGPSGGLRTNLGQSLDFYLPARKNPYSQRWSLGLQQQIGAFLLEGTYVGN